MMKAKKMADDPLMKSSEAPLMDHLVELRSRLLKSLIALAVAFAFCFYFADFGKRAQLCSGSVGTNFDFRSSE